MPYWNSATCAGKMHCLVLWNDLGFMISKGFLMYHCFLYSHYIGTSEFQFTVDHILVISNFSLIGNCQLVVHLWELMSSLVIMGLICFTKWKWAVHISQLLLHLTASSKSIVLWFILKHTLSVSFTTVLSNDLLKKKAGCQVANRPVHVSMVSSYLLNGCSQFFMCNCQWMMWYGISPYLLLISKTSLTW